MEMTDACWWDDDWAADVRDPRSLNWGHQDHPRLGDCWCPQGEFLQIYTLGLLTASRVENAS